MRSYFGLLVILASMSASCIAAPITVRVRVVGPSGPMAGFPLELKRTKIPGPLEAETNADGEAVWTFEPSAGETRTNVTIGEDVVPHAGETDSQKAARLESLRASLLGVAVPPTNWFDLPSGQSEVVHVFQIPRGFVLTGKVARTGRTLPRLVDLRVAGCGGALELDSTTGAIRLNWIPAGKATTGFMSWFDVSSMASCIPIAIPAADQNLDIGTIAIPPSWNFDASIEVTELDATVERPLQSLYNSHAEGFTLISVDGLKLFDSRWSSVASRGGVVKSRMCQVPAGTYYVVPDVIGPTDFQLKLFGKIVAGTDLTQSGVPRIVIAAGETKHVEIHSVEIINAIYALP